MNKTIDPDDSLMDRAVEAFWVAKAECVERRQPVSPSISTKVGLLAAMPYLVSLGLSQTANPGKAGKMQRIYLSGPMTGLPDLNFPAFHAEAARLRALGYDVINPADLPEGISREECLRIDIMALMICDTLAQMDGCKASRGATLEAYVASQTGIRTVCASGITKYYDEKTK
jgi:hypothetical protein